MEGREGRASLTPTAIRNTEPPRAWLRGYRRDEVHQLLDDVADELAAVVRERDELAGHVESLEAEATRHHELESLLSSALVSAEQAANGTRTQARRESDLIIREAHAEARRTVREAEAERRHLEDGMIELRARLRTILGLVAASEEHVPLAQEAPVAEAAAEPQAIASGVREVVA
jgi:cell division initiation protein